MGCLTEMKNNLSGLKVQMMRIAMIIFGLFCSVVQSASFAAEVASPANLSKAEFIKAVPLIKSAKKLLDSNGDRLYFSTSDGAVAVTDTGGKLQMKQNL